MDVIGSHASRLPVLDDRWTPRPYERDELADGLVAGLVAGPVRSHDLDNVRRNIRLLFEGDPDKQFGMTGLRVLPPREVLELVERAAGFRADGRFDGPVWVDPALVLGACEAVGLRLATAVERGDRVLLATGHPRGLDHLYIEVGRLLHDRGLRILTPADGASWIDGERGRRWIRYHEGLAMLTDEERPLHTHDADVMTKILSEDRPDLVLADHGFAGAAIERGIETISIADVNDPALVVARALGRTEVVVVMDDNVAADAYWPCFQAIAAHLP